MVKKSKKASKEETDKVKKVRIRLGGFNLFVIGLIIGLVLGAISIVSLDTQQKGALSPEKAGEKAINFISNNLLPPGISIKLVRIEEIEGTDLYKLTINISADTNSQLVESYITKDGGLLFPNGISTETQLQPQEKSQEKNQQSENIPKSSKPIVKLFVMSYCPFGLQAEKALLPVIDLLGNKIDAKIHFVNYVMHGKKEIDENLRQYCIQKEQNNKFFNYLSCFINTSNYTICLEEVNIDLVQLETCMNETDHEYNITALYNDRNTWINGRFPQFLIDNGLNQKYGVRGSPTIIINDKVISLRRAPENFKQTICSAFIEPPTECEQTLSTVVTSPGFGYSVGSPSSGGCAS